MARRPRKFPISLTRPGALVLAVIVVALVQAACVEPGSRTVTERVSGDWIRVYFTSPRYPDDDAYHYGGLDEELAAVIEQAESSVDVAAYDLDLERVTDALIAAHNDGERVRVVVESDNTDKEAMADLRRAGIPLVEDKLRERARRSVERPVDERANGVPCRLAPREPDGVPVRVGPSAHSERPLVDVPVENRFHRRVRP